MGARGHFYLSPDGLSEEFNRMKKLAAGDVVRLEEPRAVEKGWPWTTLPAGTILLIVEQHLGFRNVYGAVVPELGTCRVAIGEDLYGVTVL